MGISSQKNKKSADRKGERNMSKEEWKSTGKELGGAFTGLAKSLIRSAKDGIEKAEEWAEEEVKKDSEPAETQGQESNVFNDGTWRETGKELGKAFMSLGKTLVGTGEEAVEKAEEWAETNDDDTPKES
uniref:Uncharacterized protein n=1 Tax=uncultured bacterium Contigcl_1539 TaxID=1393650 RepID=W0FR13_9BACT|nr:hypothetical protein [uncultured bacterium Contigcl_1539]